MYFRLVFMTLKDYYKILGVTPTATETEIRKAFRRLALQHHPDKNEGNHLSEALFLEIQEAYEVLSDPQQREEYNYKRWYNRSIGEAFVQRALTPEALLMESRKLQSFVVSMNIFQIDYDALSFHIRQVLSDSNTGILLQANNAAINRQIVRNLLLAAAPLPLSYLQPITLLLARLAGNDDTLLREIAAVAQQRKRRDHWDRYKWIVVVLITILLCYVMYLIGR